MRTGLLVKLSILLITFIFSTESIFSQTNFYPSDTIWRRTVHRILDLNRPKNKEMQHVYSGTAAGNKSLIQIILNSVENFGIDAYVEVQGNRFEGLMTLNELYNKLGGKSDTIWVEDVDNPDAPPEMQVVHEGTGLDAIERFEIIEEYFFVKKSARFGKVIIGIKPILAYVKEDPIISEEEESEEGEGERKTYKEVAWFRFDQLRSYLEQEELRDPANQNSYYNYLMKFESGDFESYIIKINNSFGVGIADYTDADENSNEPTLQMILESRRIEYELFNFEMNLWEF
ncbi:MAG: hypothetical protein ABFS35_12030 [Bacteroidota bacterium]